jgi:GTP cyclohydrolase IA
MAYDKSKSDPKLGRQVQKHLIELGLTTPTTNENLNEEDKLRIVEHGVKNALVALGYDLKDDSLKDTPKRVAKMWIRETMWGLDPNKFPKITTIENKMQYDEMLIEKNITVKSLCEHHLVYFGGRAHVGYIPKHKVVGLSKLNRVVEYFAHRAQVQERLTAQIMETLKLILETDDVAVVLDCAHMCVASRGVEDHASSTITSALSGAFKEDPRVREEFLSFIK